VLAKLKGLRGSKLDIFGYSEERRHEREDIAAFEADVERLLTTLNPANIGLATAIAKLPMDVRGFGPVKAKARDEVATRRVALWAKFDGAVTKVAA
jgi:indolepyruvate ferredoxin oxidoreductase